MDYKELSSKLNKFIPDAKLKQLLFNDDDLDPMSIRDIGPIYNVLIFVFIYLFIQYKYRKVNDLKISNSQNAKRIYNALDNIYTTENVELSLIIYILKEVLIDVDKNLRHSDFNTFLTTTGYRDINNIVEIGNIIRTWLQSSKTAESNKEKLCNLLDYITKIFYVFPNIKVEIDDEGFVAIDNSSDNIKYPTYGILKVINNELYYLYNFEKNDNNTYTLNYKKFGSYSEVYAHQMDKKVFGEMLKNRPPKKPTRVLIKNTFPKQYSYLNNLSLSISEALNEDVKQDIFYAFREEYPYIFTNDNSIDVKTISYYDLKVDNWDEIISMLILEISPTSLLHVIFDSREFSFETFINNLSLRYGDETIIDSIKESIRKFENIERKNTERFNVDITREKDIYNSIKINCKIKSIMECLSKKENIVYESFTNEFVGTLDIMKHRIIQIENSNDTIKAKTLELNYLLEGIFRYLLCFYKGVIAFGMKRDALLEHSDDSSSQADKAYTECAKAFFAEIQNKKEIYSSMSIGKLIGALRDFASEVYNGSTITAESKALYGVIGRYYFVDIKSLNNLVDFSKSEAEECIINQTDKKPITNIVHYINTAKHNKPDYPILTDASFRIFSSHINRLIDYLLCNEDNSIMFEKNHISTKPIYPYVVFYSFSIGNRDGIKIPQFSISINNKDGVSIEKKILTGIEYDISKKYYCIPNDVTSNEHWWIEPFLIDSEEFDKNMQLNFNDKAKDADDEDFE